VVGGNSILTLQDSLLVLRHDGRRASPRSLFNDLYDNEHLPLLLKLPGSVNAVRIARTCPGQPRYLCVYEVENTELPMSKLWNDTSESAVEAGSAAVHLQQALHRRRAHLLGLRRA
jgi:hypothetical protein